MNDVLLEVRNLQVDFTVGRAVLTAVHDVNFTIHKGRTLAVVGESGCGKSVTATSIMRLLPRENSSFPRGEILLEGRDILQMSARELRKIRGNRISMIFQDPMTALNPVYKIGRQMVEMIRAHHKMSRQDAYRKCLEMLKTVGIPLPEQRMEEYPHQLSGGMRQRVMIAMALSCNADLLIADEPTTALDVTIQAQILDQMRRLKAELGTAILLITHDMGVVAEMADDVMVMYAGEIVEYGTAGDVFDRPTHPYTRGLLRSIPRLDAPDDMELYTIEGVVPALDEFGSGCRFANRCDCGMACCAGETAPLVRLSQTHVVRCHRCALEGGN